jgi:bifunctional DNA-binding transcriptional regulator/antitoxin component of YhaV-PrlF toxin-antitoxin module
MMSMTTLTVTANGRITLRKDLLRHLGAGPGDSIAIEKLPEGRIELRAAKPVGVISDVFGLLHRDEGPTLSIEQISEAAAEGWTGQR